MGHFRDSTPTCQIPCDKHSTFGKCQQSLTWLYDCSGLTSSTTPTKTQCHDCNFKIVIVKLTDLLTLIIPFGAAYGDWLGGVTNPDLNLTIKAFTGSFLIDLIYQSEYAKEGSAKKSDAFSWALLNALSTSGWVLMAQVVQDFVFHGAPNRVIGSLVAGLANYYRTAGKLPFKISGQQSGGLVIFASSLASFAGNWSMMGDNVMSRFVSCVFAGFLSFFSAIEKGSWEACIIDNKLMKKAFLGALQLGFASSLMGTLAQSAIGKPIISGLASGCISLFAAKEIFTGTNFKLCQ